MEKIIYVAGGCFWGVEKYLSLIHGVVETEVGYANGQTLNPKYEEIGKTGHVEAVKVRYDNKKVSLGFLLDMLYEVIDPTSSNRQGGDVGRQYRTGIYYIDVEDISAIKESLQRLQKKYEAKIVVEVCLLENYMRAEEYHQTYLDKNIGGYCHIGSNHMEKAKHRKIDPYLYKQQDKDALKESLSSMAYEVTQNNATEPAFSNEYDKNSKVGIYVDITTGEPLFVSSDKFESGCGWPAFSKPIEKDVVKESEDIGFGMMRTEVRSRIGDVHLGHVFKDGPKEMGGLRYCINGAALRFVPLERMKEEGYDQFIELL